MYHSHMTAQAKNDSLNAEQTFVAFDTETTGVWAPAHRLVEIGAIKFRLGDNTVQQFQSLIQPERSIPGEVIEIHGITDDMVAASPTAETVLDQFMTFCGQDSVLIAHNVTFDISFLACELERYGKSFGNNLFLDTLDICQRVFPDLESYSLLSLAQHFNLASSQEHRALGDASLVHLLFMLAAEHSTIPFTPHNLESHFAVYHAHDWRDEQRPVPDQYTPLLTAIDNAGRVKIAYQHRSLGDQWRVVRPIGIYSLGSRFYLHAFCEKVQAERTFRLDRVSAFEILPEETPEN
ncbi:WYL domain-containing protein [candidate division GN15 bacterium]|nr:WYL domain-containing protein [candidate division GN15 bacterium]